jgi:hypothetical protein
MQFHPRPCLLLLLISLLILIPQTVPALPQSSSSSSSASNAPKSTHANTALDPGSVTNGLYRNKTLGFACKIPAGWVLRTDEMNARDEQSATAGNDNADSAKAGPEPASSAGGKVLLAAFSRPPEARGQDVNSSILIAAESTAAYPGLKDAVQYFDPLTEVAKAQGFEVDEDPYEIAIGNKTLVRGDFHKDVGTRVMRQSTLAMLENGYAVSITVIGGTEDEVEELIDRLDFQTPARASPSHR